MNTSDELENVLNSIESAVSESEIIMEDMHSADQANWDSRVHCFSRQAKLNITELLKNTVEKEKRAAAEKVANEK